MTTAFSIEQQAIINGSLLGDGHITNPKHGNSCFSKTQCGARREYLDWTSTKLAPYSSSVSEYNNYCNGKKYKKAVYLAKALPEFTALRHKWYPDGKKIVPRDLQLSPLAIAIWFFDDGSNSIEARICKFATYCFTVDECSYLCDRLAQFNIKSHVGHGNVIMTRAESYKTLIDMVKPFMLWPCFEHKMRYRDSQLAFTTDDEAREMLRLHEAGHIYKDIAAKVGKSISVVSAVLRGDRAKHLGLAPKVGNVALNNTSGYTGVCWDKSRGKWVASMKLAGKTVNLGRFATKVEAVVARKIAQKVV